MSSSKDTIQDFANQEYKYGFVTDIEDPFANPLTLASYGFNLALQAIDVPGVTITFIDIFSLTRAAWLDPAVVGAELRGPCVVTGGPDLDCSKTVFWDGIHPTVTGHALIAEEAANILGLQ